MSKKYYIITFLSVAAIAIAVTVWIFPDVRMKRSEQRILNMIEEANYCTQTSDCAVIPSKCPFDCYVALNKEHAGAVSRAIDEYESMCMYGCIEMGGVECLSGRCELVR